MFTEEISQYNFRASSTLVLPKYKTRTYGYRSFAYMGAKVWNNVPNELRIAPTLPQFKDLLAEWAPNNMKFEEYV